MSEAMVRVLATICPTCGPAENGQLKIKARSVRERWYCADCLGAFEAADLHDQLLPERYERFRLLIATEPVEA